MAKRIAVSFKELAPRIVSPAGEYRPARVQSFEVRGNFPSRTIQEHGNPLPVGADVDIPEYTVTLNALDVSTKIFAALTGTADPYPASGVSTSQLGRVDLIGDVKDATAAEYVKSIYIPKSYVQGFRYSYSVDGNSTEEYTFVANSRTVFSHDVFVDTFAAGVTSPQTLSHTPETLKNGKKAISVILDGEYLTETDASPTSGEYKITGSSISFADTVTKSLVVTYKSASEDTWTDISDTDIPVVITGKRVPVLLKTNNIPRVQSVTVNGTLQTTAIKEQGNTEVVGYVYQAPEVTGDITVLDTDTELVSLFSTGALNSTDTEFRSCELLTDRDISLEIQLLDSTNMCTSSGATVVKTLYIPKIMLTGESYTSNVGDSVTLTFPYRAVAGEVIVYSGARA